jgi:hypothetical protein
MSAFLGPWTNNRAGQLSFLKWLVAWDQSAQELFGPAYPGRRTILPSDPNRPLVALLLPSIWNFTEVLERLLDLAARSKDLEDQVRDILASVSQSQPECLLLGFSKVLLFVLSCLFDALV